MPIRGAFHGEIHVTDFGRLANPLRLCRVRAPRFRAGGMVLFIPWRGGAERGAGLSPSWRPRRRRFFFLVLSGGGRRGRAMGSASPTAGLQQYGGERSPKLIPEDGSGHIHSKQSGSVALADFRSIGFANRTAIKPRSNFLCRLKRGVDGK
jgi:hypothetical protein